MSLFDDAFCTFWFSREKVPTIAEFMMSALFGGATFGSLAPSVWASRRDVCDVNPVGRRGCSRTRTSRVPPIFPLGTPRTAHTWNATNRDDGKRVGRWTG
jgi:hypothetical protein